MVIEPSVVVAPASVQELPRSTVSVPEVTVITGAVVSSTMTVRVLVVALLLAVSIAVTVKLCEIAVS